MLQAQCYPTSMIVRLSTFLLLTSLFLLPGCKPEAQKGVGQNLVMAREALANDQNETVIETLEPAISELQDEPELGEALFLLGKAHFQRAEKAVSGKSSQQRMFQAMPKEVISDLLSAYEYFMEAAWLVNEEGILIQIYYFAGRTQDAGYLQDFQKASEHYKSAFSISATDTYGQKALERYSVIAKWLDMYKSE